MKKVVIVLTLAIMLIVALNFDISLYVDIKDISVTSMVTGSIVTLVIMLLSKMVRALISEAKEGSEKIESLMSRVDELLYREPTARDIQPASAMDKAEMRRLERAKKYGHMAFQDIVELRTAR
jgi:hypothetical protein